MLTADFYEIRFSKPLDCTMKQQQISTLCWTHLVNGCLRTLALYIAYIAAIAKTENMPTVRLSSCVKRDQIKEFDQRYQQIKAMSGMKKVDLLQTEDYFDMK